MRYHVANLIVFQRISLNTYVTVRGKCLDLRSTEQDVLKSGKYRELEVLEGHTQFLTSRYATSLIVRAVCGASVQQMLFYCNNWLCHGACCSSFIAQIVGPARYRALGEVPTKKDFQGGPAISDATTCMVRRDVV